MLIENGFTKHATWNFDGETITLSTKPPKEPGVYAFSIDGIVQYVGVATMGLSKRLYFYSKPGVSQKTSIRLNKEISRLLRKGIKIDLLIAMPPDTTWNNLPVNTCTGLETGLIKAFALPWNKRGA